MRTSLASITAVAICFSLVAGCGNTDPEPAADAPDADATASAAVTVEPEPTPEPEEPVIKRFEFRTVEDVDRLFDELGYTPERWQAGIREIPKVYFATISEKWQETAAHDITVMQKKRLFFRALAPIALYSNKLILEERSRLDELKPLHEAGRLSDEDASWLADLAVEYGVVDDASSPLDAAGYQELMRRVDIVPVSLALSQSAEESGWGTSRFAAEGNALFGQWAWGDDAIKPEKQRSGKGNYGIAAFQSTLDSVRAYMHNLNTHRAYGGLRARRAEIRAQGIPVTGFELAKSLTSYSERGAAYVESLHAIMRVNHLAAADDAYLGDGPVFLMVRVD